MANFYILLYVEENIWANIFGPWAYAHVALPRDDSEYLLGAPSMDK